METSFAIEPLGSSPCPALIAVSPEFAGTLDEAPMNIAVKACFGATETWAASSAVTGADSETERIDCLRRLASFLPNCCCSHRRMVSRPISMPISRKPPTSDSADSPARLKRSNSSRCGSSCAVAWLRGCRAWATAWASVVGRGVVNGEWMGNDMGAIASFYMWWSGSARGAPEAQSKRKRLDVGVLPYFFVLFFLGESGFILGSLIGWFISLLDFLVFVSGVSVELVSLSLWFHRFSAHFACRIILGSFGPSLVVGGGGC